MPDRWIVLSLDGLATAAISAYGSSWNETPAIDRLAAFGTLWDRAIVSSDDSIQVLGDLWMRWQPQGSQSASEPPSSRSPRSSGRSELFLNSGVQAIQLAKLAGSLGFDECTLVEAIPEGATETIEHVDIEETCLGKLLLPVLERLGDSTTSGGRQSDWSLLWVHSDTLTRCWDAPRSLFPVEEDDEYDDAPVDQAEWSLEDFGHDASLESAPAASLKPPALFAGSAVPYLQLQADAHPDLITSWMQTYGCQIRLLDRLVEWLLDSIEPDGGKTGLAILGSSGFSLGQNGWIGHRAGPIRSPQIHVPAVLFDGHGHGIRMSGVHPLGEVMRWLGQGPQPNRTARPTPSDWADESQNQSACVVTDSIRADRVLTTDQWFFVREAERSSLFLKPDDRDDGNDVADRCREVIEEMERQF
ncbi:MAG: hypothetical protein ACO1RT_17880 [Planctomycetaceae bacterium]